MLNQEQLQVFNDVMNNNRSVYIGGGGGVGKSFLINEIVQKKTEQMKNIVVSATTGTASVNINGKTLYSVFGLTPFIQDYEEHAEFLMKRRKDIVKIIKTLHTLVIDEVSMLDDIMCDGVSVILSAIRKDDSPFGGVQMVFVGDMFQLPPVKNDWCFKSYYWRELNPKKYDLTTIVRQKDDIQFQSILKNIRVGNCQKEIVKKLLPLKHTVFPDHISPTHLYATNVDVDKINTKELNKLKEQNKKSMIYNATFINMNPCTGYDADLCEDAQVMVTRNIDIENNLVNGTRAVVVDLHPTHVHIKCLDGTIHNIEFTTEDRDIKGKQQIRFMPLRLAYALTIHKAQGATLDCMEISLDEKVFGYGQAYTGLSRARDMKSIKIVKLSMKAFHTSPDVIEWYKELL